MKKTNFEDKNYILKKCNFKKKKKRNARSIECCQNIYDTYNSQDWYLSFIDEAKTKLNILKYVYAHMPRSVWLNSF